jgi:phosphoenolpyruvate synthase/pyruvate phosphate dikinase
VNILRFYDLEDAAQPDPVHIGQEGFELARAAAAGLSIVPSFIIGTGVFRSYRELDQLHDSVISAIISFAAESEANQLTIRPTTAEKLIGLPAEETTEVDQGHIRYLIERIYRSWNSSRARGYRENRRISEDQGSPAVIVQAPVSSRTLSISSRDPRTGLRTSAEDCRHNVNNRLTEFRSEYLTLMDKVERITRRPSQIDFQENEDGLYVAGLAMQVITSSALMEFIKTQYEATNLDDLDVLSMLEPRMLGSVGRTSYNVISKDPWAVRGIAGSPGAASGHLVWPGSAIGEAEWKARIFVAREYTPGDLNLLVHCVGAFSSRGGKTSHLAVVARGIRIPAVTGVDELDINVEDRIIMLRGERLVSDFAFVEGTVGVVSFGARPNIRGVTEIKSVSPMSFINWVDDLAQSIVDRGEFAALPVPTQMHIAALRQMIAKIRAGHD